MAVYHTQIRPGLTVKVTRPNDDRPDADHVVEYMDGAKRCRVRDDAGWSNNPAVPRGAIDGELKTRAAWQAERDARVEQTKQIIRGMFEDLEEGQRALVEQVFEDVETRDLLQQFIQEVLQAR
jgi:hypothetical protein